MFGWSGGLLFRTIRLEPNHHDGVMWKGKSGDTYLCKGAVQPRKLYSCRLCNVGLGKAMDKSENEPELNCKMASMC